MLHNGNNLRAEQSFWMKTQTVISLLFNVCVVVLFAVLWHQRPEPEPELSSLMGDLQRHSHKLGLAVRSKNSKLSNFYIHELEEVLELIQTHIPMHDDKPIAEFSRTIMTELINQIETNTAARDWQASLDSYGAVVDGCNRCHAATDHEFIRIIPDPDGLVFNQSFDSDDVVTKADIEPAD